MSGTAGANVAVLIDQLLRFAAVLQIRLQHVIKLFGIVYQPIG